MGIENLDRIFRPKSIGQGLQFDVKTSSLVTLQHRKSPFIPALRRDFFALCNIVTTPGTFSDCACLTILRRKFTMKHRQDYFQELMQDVRKVTPEPDMQAAMIIADGLNGVRKALLDLKALLPGAIAEFPDRYQ